MGYADYERFAIEDRRSGEARWSTSKTPQRPPHESGRQRYRVNAGQWPAAEDGVTQKGRGIGGSARDSEFGDKRKAHRERPRQFRRKLQTRRAPPAPVRLAQQNDVGVQQRRPPEPGQDTVEVT